MSRTPLDFVLERAMTACMWAEARVTPPRPGPRASSRAGNRLKPPFLVFSTHQPLSPILQGRPGQGEVGRVLRASPEGGARHPNLPELIMESSASSRTKMALALLLASVLVPGADGSFSEVGKSLGHGSSSAPGGLASMWTSVMLLRLLGAWLVVEVIFFLVMRLLVRRLNELTPPPPRSVPALRRPYPVSETHLPPWHGQHSDLEAHELVSRIIHVLETLEGVYPVEQFVSIWCGAQTLSQVRVGNFEKFISWAVMARDCSDLSDAQRELIHREVSGSSRLVTWAPRLMTDTLRPDGQGRRLLKHFRVELEEGHNPDITPLRMTLEPLVVVHWPLLAYFVCCFLPRMAGDALLYASGFCHHSLGGMSYWHRPAPPSGG
jgi:hypothetical protein